MNECQKCHAPTMQKVGSGIDQCAACSARVAHGQLMPRIVVQPHPTDRRFVVVTIHDQNVRGADESPPPSDPVQVVVDKALAQMWGSSLFSVSR